MMKYKSYPTKTLIIFYVKILMLIYGLNVGNIGLLYKYFRPSAISVSITILSHFTFRSSF